MLDMRSFCGYVHSLYNIRRTPVSCAIVAMPFLLCFALLHTLVINSDDQPGAVVSNAAGCAEIGKGIFLEGGSVVDTAIATMLCEGILLPSRAGIGGGFTAIMYIGGKFDTISSTPWTPEKFSDEFFKMNPLPEALAAAVPGELVGYWSMHQKYGQLPWKQLFRPILHMCNEQPSKCESQEWDLIKFKYGKEFVSLSSVRPTLLKTLERIANEGTNVFYRGEIGKMLTEDVRRYGGVMTLRDLNTYRVTWNPRPVTFNMRRSKKAYTTPLPSSGAIVALVMNVIKNYANAMDPLFWHRIIEALKYGYRYSYGLSDTPLHAKGKFKKHIGDVFKMMTNPDFASILRFNISQKPFDIKNFPPKIQSYYMSSTSNICVLAPNGDAIAITTTMLAHGTDIFVSPRTGILLNNEMYSLRPFANRTAKPYTWPGRRPLTAHCPTIVLNKESARVHFIVGASGTDTAPAQVITALIEYVLLHSSVTRAANEKFFYPNIFENRTYFRSNPRGGDDEDEETMNTLKLLGYNISMLQRSRSPIVRTCIGCLVFKSDVDFTHDEEGSTALILPMNEVRAFPLFMLVMLIAVIVIICGYEIVIYTAPLSNRD